MLDKDSHDSHEVVATFMKFMNTHCAETLASMNTGIFRNQAGTGGSDEGTISHQHAAWSAFGGPLSATYSTINEGHAHLGLAHYTHITSPIRRLVDLINMRILINAHSKEHLESSTIEKINKVSKSAKKAQMDCELYSKVLGADPETVYTGTIVDIDTDEFGKITKTVYLEELKTYARVKMPMDIPPQIKVKVYLFDEEHSLRRKIRVECIE